MHGLGQGRRKRAVAIRYLAGVLCYSNLGDAVEAFLIRAQIRLDHGKASSGQCHKPDQPLSSFSATPASQRKSQARLLRKWKLYERVHELHTAGMSLRRIGEELGLARNTVRKYCRQAPDPPLPLRASRLDPYEDYLLARWSQGERNAALMRDKLRKVNPPAKPPRHFGVAPDGYNAALDLSHTALRAESEGERYTGVLYRSTLAFALRV